MLHPYNGTQNSLDGLFHLLKVTPYRHLFIRNYNNLIILSKFLDMAIFLSYNLYMATRRQITSQELQELQGSEAPSRHELLNERLHDNALAKAKDTKYKPEGKRRDLEAINLERLERGLPELTPNLSVDNSHDPLYTPCGSSNP